MNYHLSIPDCPPTPAELVAFADGELDAARARQIEVWLAGHPDLAAAVEEHRQVLRQVRELAPPAPTEAAWEHVRSSIGAALPAPRAEPVRSRRRILAAVAGVAALLMLTIPTHVGRQPLVGLPAPAAAEPILLAAADEVEIVSIDGVDVGALLVGEPPLRRPLELAAAGDVELNFAEAGEEGWVPAMGGGELGTPMYIVRTPSGPEERP